MSSHAVHPVIPVAQTGAHSGRQCGDCKACCEGWLAARIHDHDMHPGVACCYLKPQGCSIYEQRPAVPCQSFVCGWLLPNSPFPASFRPDQLGVIFVPITWQYKRAWILVSAGQEPSEELLAMMRQHSTQTGEPHMIKRQGRMLCFGSPAFQQDMLAREQRGETPWG